MGVRGLLKQGAKVLHGMMVKLGENSEGVQEVAGSY